MNTFMIPHHGVTPTLPMGRVHDSASLATVIIPMRWRFNHILGHWDAPYNMMHDFATWVTLHSWSMIACHGCVIH